MLQVPNYTLKHPQNKSDPVLVAERRLASTGEHKSDRKANWRKSASWSLLLATGRSASNTSLLVATARYWSLSEQHQFMKNQHYGLNSKLTQNSIFHAITHKWASFKLTYMIIHIKTPIDTQIYTNSYHKARFYTFTQNS